MVDGLGSLTSGKFLGRRHSAGNGIRSFPIASPQLPPPTSDHDCREFRAPEGTYCLVHRVFLQDLQPSFSVGTSATLVSIDYQPITATATATASTPTSSSSNNHHHHLRQHLDLPSENDHSRTPSLSSSSSSANNKSNGNPADVPINNDPPPSASLSTSPHPHNSTSTTFSFLSKKNSSRRIRTRTMSIKKHAHHSSFVSRIVTHSQFTRMLQSRNNTEDSTDLFFNCGHSFIWTDTLGHPEDPLLQITFAKAYPTAHDVNLATKSQDHLDTVIGFNTGDIIWFEPHSQKYCRINKGGIMNATSVTAIRWLHGSDNLFMAAFADGTMMVLDKDKEDAPFHPENNILSGRGGISVGADGPTDVHQHEGVGAVEPQKLTFRVSKPTPRVSTKSNPVSHWKISTKSITAFAFSPDDQHVAVVGSDGLLWVINFVHETLYDIYQSYYGGLTCVAWSPDGRYILTGGEDDLVTIWAFREQRIVARCQGHSSWVTGVAFDPWHCDDENVYRFASVGEDGKLILWDFSVHAIHRPKARSSTLSGGAGTGGGRHRGSSVSSQHMVIPPPSGSLLGAAAAAKSPTLHALQAKTHVAFLQPTVVKTVHADPCVAVYFKKDVIVTTDKRGRICMWRRPRPSVTRH